MMKTKLEKQNFNLRFLSLGIVILSMVYGLKLAAQLKATDFVDGGSNGSHYMYRYLKPIGYDVTKKYPLVLFLHGSGESGTDNTKQIDGEKAWVNRFTTPSALSQYPAFLLAPQLGSVDLGHQPDEIMAIIEKLKTQFSSIDENRIYITGMSMGGRGTWGCVLKNPTYFACVAPCCSRLPWNDTIFTSISNTSSTTALSVAQAQINLKHIAKLPIWDGHGDKDGTVTVEWSRNNITAIRNLGGAPIYSEYAGVNHTSWKNFYPEPELLDWMFSQNKLGGIAPALPSNIILTSGTESATITWTAPDMTNGKVMCYHVYKNGIRLTIGLENLAGADATGLSKLLKITSYTDNNYKAGDSYEITAVNYRLQESIGTTDVNEIAKNNDQISLYPNPAKDIATINGVKSDARILVFNVHGEQIIETFGNKVNVANLPAGLYLLKANNRNIKFIK